MNKLIIPVFKTTYKRKPAKIFMGFAAFPLILLLLSFLPTDFMQIGGNLNSVSFMDFFDMTQSVLYDTVLPIIALIYLVIFSINQEIESGTLYLFKDIDRDKIINAKIISIIMVYFLFTLILFVATGAAYYFYFKNLSYASGDFFPQGMKGMQFMIISIIGKIYIFIITIVIAVFLSLRFNNSITLVVTIFFALFSNVSEKLGVSKYFFPNTYQSFFTKFGFVPSLLMMSALFIIYISVFYYLSKKYFRRLEF